MSYKTFLSDEVSEKGNDYSDAKEEESEEDLEAGDCLSVGGCWSLSPCTERLGFICQKKIRP